MVGMMNLGWRFEPSRQSRRMVSPILGLSQRRIDQCEVVVEVGAGDRRQDRQDLLGLDLGEEGADQGVGHALVDEVDVHQARGVGDDRVAAVQDADLHVLERGDVGHELGADLLEGRAAGGETVLDHPLDEVLAEHRPGVLDAELVAGDRPLAVGGRRRDAVDHAVGEGDVVADPAGELGSCASARPRTALRGDDAVVRDVVAGEHGEGRDAGGAAGAQAGEDQAEHGLRRVGVRGVGGDRRDRRVEGAGGGIDEVAALGDGHRHDAGGGQRQLPRGSRRRPSAAGSRSSPR